MSFPKYPTYKESGVAWLEKIPECWSAGPLKRVISKVESGTSVNSIDTPAENGDLGVLKTSCVYGGSFNENENKRVVEEEYHRVTCPLRSNALIVSRMNTPELVGAAGLVAHARDGLYLPDRLWQIAFDGAIPAFAYYWTLTVYYRAQVQTACTGTSASMQNLSQPQFCSFIFPCPTLSEQSVIAAFLDRETAKIDALVAEQEKLIELLKEKRQAVISHAVTKGLDPNVPMKGSGVECLGEVPEHWAVVPLRNGIEFQEGPGILAIDFYEEGIPLVRVSGVQGRWVTLEGCNYLNPEKVKSRWDHFRLSEGDLLISASASMGTISEVGSEAHGAIPYTGLIRLWPNNGRTTRDFIRAIMGSTSFLTQAEVLRAGATIQHFGPTHLRQMKIALPPIEEQTIITDYLEHACTKIDTLLSEAQQSIDLLKERRSALISAAVTGKIDVRGLADTTQ